jgi:hypothetical protein
MGAVRRINDTNDRDGRAAVICERIIWEMAGLLGMAGDGSWNEFGFFLFLPF